MTQDQVRAISELVTNLLHPQFPLSKANELQLQRQKHFLRQLSNTKLSVSEKKKLIEKKVSVILLIVRATLPFLKKHYATS